MRLIVCLIVFLCALPAVAAEAWMDKAIAMIQGQSKVVEVMFNQDSQRSLWVSMVDDGTRRDGYAESLCIDLFDAGMPVGGFTVIHIWDAGAMATGSMKEIGRYECERAE